MKASLSFNFLDLCLYNMRVLALVLVLVYIFYLCLYDARKIDALHPSFCASRSGGLGCCFFLLSFILHFVLSLKWTFCGVPFYYCLSFISHLVFLSGGLYVVFLFIIVYLLSFILCFLSGGLYVVFLFVGSLLSMDCNRYPFTMHCR